MGAYSSAVLADSPNAYWKFNEGVGVTSIIDYSGNGLTATTHGSPTLGVAGPITGDTACTFVSASLQYADAPSNSKFDLGDIWTFEVWYKRSSVQATFQHFLSKGTGAYGFLMYNTNKIDLQNEGTVDLLLSTVTITDTTSWHHIVGTKNGSTLKLYLDSVDVSAVPSNVATGNTATALSIGRKTSNIEYLDGTIAHLAMYPTALSAARVLAHWNAGRVPDTSTPVAWLRA